jgi:hypothetical protein
MEGGKGQVGYYTGRPYKTVADVSTGTAASANMPAWEGEMPDIDALADQFEAKGATRDEANRLAEETIRDATGPSNPGYDEITRQRALERLQRIMGPEMRRTPR